MKIIETTERSALSIREFAASIGVSTKTVYRLISDEKIKAPMILGQRRIPITELDRLLAEGTE